jgi:hypothetical protein
VKKRPQLVVTVKKSDLVAGRCSVCQATFSIYANEVSMAELQRAFNEHVEKNHRSAVPSAA